MIKIRRNILVPQVLDDRLAQLAELGEETNGILVCKPQQQGHLLNYETNALYVTALGTSHQVVASPTMMRMLNLFFQHNPQYHVVKWHTHCRGTGEEWFSKLSRGDIDHYQGHLEVNSFFIGMMVSPTQKILYGRGEISLEVVPTSPRFEREERVILQKLENAAIEVGYQGLPTFSTTARR